jgi:hypothetical protein
MKNSKELLLDGTLCELLLQMRKDGYLYRKGINMITEVKGIRPNFPNIIPSDTKLGNLTVRPLMEKISVKHFLALEGVGLGICDEIIDFLKENDIDWQIEIPT